MCVKCVLDVERSDVRAIVLVEMSANLKLVVLKSADLSVVDWWMSENWGNVCEFRVECETNDGRMRVDDE